MGAFASGFVLYGMAMLYGATGSVYIAQIGESISLRTPAPSALVPVGGLLAAVFYRWEDRELRRQCPRCGRVVKLYDAKCMRCGEELAFPETGIVSEATARRRAQAG